MNIMLARQALETQFIAHMTTNFPNVVLVFGNDGTKPPKPTTGARWVRFAVVTTSNLPAALGHVFRRRDGFLSIEIYSVRGEGENPADEIATSLQDIYDGTCTEAARFIGGVVPVPIGARDGQAWAQKNITVDFQTDFTKGA